MSKPYQHVTENGVYDLGNSSQTAAFGPGEDMIHLCSSQPYTSARMAGRSTHKTGRILNAMQ